MPIAAILLLPTALVRPPVVILPGFGNADVDYRQPMGQPEGLVSALQRRGFDHVDVLELPRWEWIRVAGGLFDIDFWLNRQRPTGRAYGWYVERARRTILEASHACDGDRVLVIAHSAGGWLARAALGDGKWETIDETADESVTRVVQAGDVVCGLVTLGAPHFPPPAGLAPCATRGALAYCDTEFPGSFLQESDGIAYVTVAGTAIEGRQEDPAASAADDDTGEGRSSASGADELYSRRGEGSAARVAYTNYLALAGDGGAVGDGVIPLPCAHLDGAEQVTLEGVLHSINEAGTTLPTDRWYGSEAVIDRWLQPVCAKLESGR